MACVVDHYSGRVMGFAVFSKEPKSVDVRTFRGRLVRRHGAPNYLISDKGRQFDCTDSREWRKRKSIEPRYASTGTLIASATRNDVEPFVYLRDIFTRMPATPVSQIEQFLPDRWGGQAK